MNIIEKIKRYYRYIFKNPPSYIISIRKSVERHGNVYGGWCIIKNSLNKNSIVYSVGIGNDVSFDLSIISKYKCKIFAYDPTPKVSVWIEKQALPSEFLFFPIGLSDHVGNLTFYTPINEMNISHTSVQIGSAIPVEVECMNLAHMMFLNSHSQIDLLKLDIEGFEFAVIDDILNSSIRPRQLLIEFHHFFPGFGNDKTELAIQKLKSYNYLLYYVSDSFCEYSFIYHP